MRDFTVVVPTWNMGRYLQPLFDSIINSDFGAQVEEVIFVCEKSTDGSAEIIASLAERQKERRPGVRLIQPEKRRGLFVARHLGAKAAQTKKIMFIDSRITLPAASGKALPVLSAKYPGMVANLDIDIDKNIFCLYWRRSHATFFRSEDAVRDVLTITSKNFHNTRIGGTCFFCSRDLFVEISERYIHQPLFSDDTYVLADLVEREPLTLHPDFRINWEPRDSALIFLKHLYGRGPGFAQYHFFRQRGGLFYATLAAAMYAGLAIFFLFLNPWWTAGLIVIAVALMLFSTILIAKSPREFFRLAPLHAAVMIFYGLGALRGAWIVWRRFGLKGIEIAPMNHDAG